VYFTHIHVLIIYKTHLIVGAVVVMNVWSLDIQLPVQSVPITT